MYVFILCFYICKFLYVTYYICIYLNVHVLYSCICVFVYFIYPYLEFHIHTCLYHHIYTSAPIIQYLHISRCLHYICLHVLYIYIYCLCLLYGLFALYQKSLTWLHTYLCYASAFSFFFNFIFPYLYFYICVGVIYLYLYILIFAYLCS